MQCARGPRKISTTLSANDKAPLQQQLTQAFSQILSLKQQNALLMQQLEQTQHYRRLYEEQQQAIRLLQEELAFREQQHFSMNAIINNYEEINAQLTAKVQAFPCKSLLTTAEPTDHDWFLAELPPTRGFRSSRVNGSVERKQNHALTPKSGVRWQPNPALQQQPLPKKRVFV